MPFHLIFVSSPRKKTPMNRRQPYSPPTAQIPADPLRGNPCDPRDPRRCVPPLKGLPGTRATSVSYRALAPVGAGLPSGMEGRHSDAAQPTANYSLLTANWTFTFSAKERDPETGLSYFGSRYYSSDLSIWLSVDPMAAKYASLSPYVYCANNPVKLVDPNGEEIWIPGLDNDNNIIVTQEEGDDLNSFKKFMGPAYGEEEIQNMFDQLKDGSINLTKTYGREFQSMTNAINDAYNDPDFEKSENYNCRGAALAVTSCSKLQGNGPNDITGISFWYNRLENFDNSLSSSFLQGSPETASVGKTVLRFGKNDNDNPHGAVYLGRDRNGTEYVFTKNGWGIRPQITTTERMLHENNYGGNCDRSGKEGQGYYNRKIRNRR